MGICEKKMEVTEFDIIFDPYPSICLRWFQSPELLSTSQVIQTGLALFTLMAVSPDMRNDLLIRF